MSLEILAEAVEGLRGGVPNQMEAAPRLTHRQASLSFLMFEVDLEIRLDQ